MKDTDAVAGDVQAVMVTMRVLEVLGSTPDEMGITQIAAAVGTTKARVHRHIKTLQRGAWVLQDPRTERYRLGLRAMLLGGGEGYGRILRGVTNAQLQELADDVGQMVTISSPRRGAMDLVDIVHPTVRGALWLDGALGQHLPLHASAQGKIAMAFGPSSLRESLKGTQLAAITEHTTTNLRQLDAELKVVGERGWAEAPEENVVGVNTIAVPLFLNRAEFVGAIAVVGFVNAVPPAPPASLVDRVKLAGEALSAHLSAPPDYEE